MWWGETANEYATFYRADCAYVTCTRIKSQLSLLPQLWPEHTQCNGPGRFQLNVADTCIVVDVHVISWDEVASCTLQVALGLNARPARHSPIKRRRCGGTQRCRCRRAAAHQNFLIFAPRQRALPLATSCNDVQFVF